MPLTTPSSAPGAILDDEKRYRRNLRGEVDSAALYHCLAEVEERAEIADIYVRFAEAEERHAALWLARLREGGRETPSPRPRWRVRLLAVLARRFGVGAVPPADQRAGVG